MRTILTALALFLLPGGLQAQQPVPKVVSVLDGYEYEGGGILDVSERPYHSIDCFYKKGVTRLVLSIEAGINSNQERLWRKLDVLDIPTRRSESVAFCIFGTTLNLVPDPEIVCLTVVGDGPFLKIRKAWRANRRDSKFEPISPRGLKCPNVNYGGD
jgi:hypothetical protein